MSSARLRYGVRPGSGVAIYRQIVEQVRAMAAGGRLRAGELLPSVRDAAGELDVNPMTISRAYSLLEREGVIERVRGTGMRIAGPRARTTVAQRQQQIEELAASLAGRSRQLGLSDEQALTVVRAALRQSRQPIASG